MSNKFNKAQNYYIIEMTGLLTNEQILHAFDAAVSHINYQKGMARIWDFREADLSRITSDSIMSMAQYSLAFPEGINDVKVAFIVKREPDLKLTKKFKSFAKKTKTPIQIFFSIEEAENWVTG
jgi:hypothetical protein